MPTYGTTPSARPRRPTTTDPKRTEKQAMRFFTGWLCALILATPLQALASDYDVLATVFQFQPPGETDPSPNLTGVIKIDPDTGVASPFIPENLSQGFAFLSDVAVGPHDGLIYVASQAGSITRFAQDGSPLGLFAFFGTPQSPEGVTTLQFDRDGTLYAATVAGRIAEFDPNGSPQADVASGLTFPTGIGVSPLSEVYVATGGVGGDGEVVRLNGTATPDVVVPFGSVGGGSGLTFQSAPGDYNGDNVNDAADRDAWAAAYGTASSLADGNADGVIDAADYTVWRDNDGVTSRLLIPDFAQDTSGNEIYQFDLATNAGSSLTTIPVAIPDLPPEIMPVPTNVPSEVLLTPEGSLLVSTLGPSQRPFNNAALLEFAQDGTLLRRIDTITAGAAPLPPLSGIALAPRVAPGRSVPEPSAFLLAMTALPLLRRGRR